MLSPAVPPDLANFYPRPPRGGRHQDVLEQARQADISIHALREEGDFQPVGRRRTVDLYFYPRPPRGGRPKELPRRHPDHGISIHALREEGDRLDQRGYGKHRQFLSTPSARRATLRLSVDSAGSLYFYPRPPRGGRPAPPFFPYLYKYFYPRPPRGGRQQKQRQNLYFLINYTTFCTNLEEP